MRGRSDSRIMFQRLKDWLAVKDYERELDAIRRGIVARYSRGNIAMQQGRYMTEDDLNDLRKRGDAAAARLRRLAGLS